MEDADAAVVSAAAVLVACEEVDVAEVALEVDFIEVVLDVLLVVLLVGLYKL